MNPFRTSRVVAGSAALALALSVAVATPAAAAVDASLSGVVTDSSSSALAGVSVTLRAVSPDGDELWARDTTTDAAGAYGFSGLDDTVEYMVEYDLDGYAHQTWTNSGWYYYPDFIDLAAHEVRTGVDAVLYREATVSGVVSAIGIPASAFADGEIGVEVMVLDGGTGRWWPTGDVRAVAADGTYIVDDLGPDDYRFRVLYLGGRGEAAAAGPVITVAEGEDETFSTSIRPFLRDINGDYTGDIIARNSAGKLLLYPGNGTGGFLAARQIGSGWARMTAVVHTGDFSGDGLADVIARDATGGLWLYKGNGSGGWLGSTKIGSGWTSQNLIFSPGDFSGDGYTDLLSRDAKGALWLWKGTATGRIQTPAVKVGSGWAGFTAVLAASDMNEDGFPDVVARDASGYLWLYPGNGSSGWKSRVQIGTGWKPFTAIFGVGDFDGDWHADIVARDASGYLWLYPGKGTGGLDARYRIGSGWAPLLIAN